MGFGNWLKRILNRIYHKHYWIRVSQYPKSAGDNFMYHIWTCIICGETKIERYEIEYEKYANARLSKTFQKKALKGYSIEFEDMVMFSKDYEKELKKKK